jgi:hypothetical protein
MEHEHIIVTELADISKRIHTLVKQLEGDHENTISTGHGRRSIPCLFSSSNG